MTLERDQAEATVHAYAVGLRARDRDAWISLFADDAVVEDPVPSEPHVGRAALERFWEGVMSIAPEVHMEVGDVHVCGDEVAASFEMTLSSPTRQAKVRGIQLLRLDGDASIVSSKSYWEPSSVVVVEQGGGAGGSPEAAGDDGAGTGGPGENPRRRKFGRRRT